MKKSISTKILLISTIFLVMVIHSITLSDYSSIHIYLSSVVSIFYMTYSLPNIFKKLKLIRLNKVDKLLIVLIITYIIYINLQYRFINSQYINIIYNRTITLLTVIFIILNIKINNDLKEQKHFIIKVGIGTIILFLLFTVFNKNISFSSSSILEVTSVGIDGITMWFSHKSRLASYLMIILALILTSEVNKITKNISSIIIVFLIYFTKSTTAFVLVLISLLYIFMVKNIKRINPYLRYNFYNLVLISFIILITVLFQYTSSNKNIETLGDRTNIWSSIMPVILENPFGIGSSFRYRFEFREYLYVNSAHNVFMQEFLENGYICGIIYLTIIIIIILTAYKHNKIYFILLISVVILANMDITIGQELYNIFFYLIAIIYCDCNNEKYNIIKGCENIGVGICNNVSLQRRS